MSAEEVLNNVAQDAHAERRLRRDVDVEIHRGIHGILTSVDNESYAVVTCIEDGVDAAGFHEAMAATCLVALHELDQLDWEAE